MPFCAMAGNDLGTYFKLDIKLHCVVQVSNCVKQIIKLYTKNKN